MIDAHCHFDLAKYPEKYILGNENKRIITIGMTNLPSHFLMGINHVRDYRYIRLALGLHPLMANEHIKEYSKFKQHINDTSYIGEVGLDFSMEGLATKEIQIKSFEFVLDCVRNKSKILSLHSRRAETHTLDMLIENKIENAIFHWYSGSIPTLKKIIDSGFYFSINSAMVHSTNGKKIISAIPPQFILTETDFPFIENNSIPIVHEMLSHLWNISVLEVEQIITSNFKSIIGKITK